MKSKLFVFILWVLCPLVLFSQQPFNQSSLGGAPWSYKFASNNQGVPFIELPWVDAQQLLAEDSINNNIKGGAFRFGYDHQVNYNLNNSGNWMQLSTGDFLWTLGLRSPGALQMSVSFANIILPQGCRLYVMNEDHSEFHGAFDETFASIDTRMLGTELLTGEGLVLELFVPQNLRNIVNLEVYRVTHSYRDVFDVARAFGASGACMNNVRCPAYAAYDNQIRSVVCLVNGGEFCTGALINNTCNDGTPYVLTANHCGTTPGSWTFRFNWEAVGCTNPGSSPTSNSITGGTFRAASSGSDFFLCEITAASAEATLATYNIYYAGWDRTTTAAVNPYGIHHPSGDIKKISFTTGTASMITINFNGDPNTAMWQTPTWTDGVTEPGSSGSPLFNSSGRIIGDLSGGPSTCAFEGNAANGFDYYGRFNVSWTGGGTNATRLSNWLDPIACNTGATTLNGFDPNAISLTFDAQLQSITSPNGSICTGTHSPVIVIKNNGITTLTSMTINYQIDGGAAIPFAWTGSLATGASVNVTMPNITIAAGAHTYTATIVTASLNGSNTDLNTANNASTSNYTGITATSSALPLAYGFEPTAMPPTTPAAWTLTNNLAGSVTFARTTAAFSLGTASAWLNYFADNTGSGTTDDLVMPYLDFSSVGAPSTMTFDVAYRRYNTSGNFDDSLRVMVSTNCGASWSTVYSKGGTTLATVGTASTTAFVPTAGQWRNESINLNSYAGLNNVLIKFQGYSKYGQNIYIDNINIQGTPAAPPTASFTTSGNTICAGQSVTYTNTSVGATTFSWTFPGGSPGTGSTSPIVVTYATAGTYTTTLTATNVSGSNTSTQTITVNAIPTNTASNTGPYCAGATIQLNATAGATDYDWTGPNSFVQNNTQNPTIPSSSTLNTGVYTVTITNASGCTATATTSVTVNAIPTANATNGGPYCEGATIQLNSVGGSATDDWAGPSYTQNNLQNPTRPSATLAMAGTYTVTVTNGAGCSATSTTSVVVNTNPTASATNTGPYCSGATIQLNSVGGTATDDWTGPLAYAQSNTQNPTIPSSTTGMGGVYVVTVTNGAGCTATATTTVVVNPTPASTASNTGPYCPGSTIQLNSGGGTSYSWSGPSAFSNGTQNPTIPSASIANDGVYTVTVTTGSCSSTSTTTVIVANTGSATASNTGAYCEGETIDLNTISGGVGYAWTGPNSFSDNIQNPNITSATTIMAGTYSVTVTFVGGCTSSATTTVTVNTNPAAPIITLSGSPTFCSGNSIDLTSSYASGNTWSTSATTSAITVNSGGTYVVTFTDGNGCSNSASQVVIVNSLPTVTQSALGNICLTYAPVILSGGSPAGGSYSGTGVSLGQFDPGVSGTGTFNVTYTFTDGNGCTNAAVSPMVVLPCASIDGETNENIQVYPNPTVQFVNITGLSNGEHKYSIINSIGQVIRVGVLLGDGSIDLGVAAAGTYYLNVDNQFWKIIKN